MLMMLPLRVRKFFQGASPTELSGSHARPGDDEGGHDPLMLADDLELVNSTATNASEQQCEDAPSEDGDEDHEDVNVTDVDGWEPSMTLAVKDDLMYGEEDEEELYCQRAKLFRFESKSGTWKHCGFGDAKLLKHNVTGQVRFLFRLEKTMKILANHCVCDAMPYCDLRQHTSTERCWIWTAPDCATGLVRVRRFALKFTSDELTAAFQERFDFAKCENRRAVEQVHAVSVTAKCDDVQVHCEMPVEVIVARPTSGPAAGSASAAAAEDGRATQDPANAQPSAHLAATSAPPQDRNTDKPKSDIAFETCVPGNACEYPNEAPFESCKEDCEEDVEEEVISVPGWSPSITLDVKTHLETGEENEQQMYCQRAKLLKFSQGSWNLCGLGHAKLLKNTTTGQARFVFRLEQTMKLMANHYLVDCLPYCRLQQNGASETCWVWAALDNALGPLKATQFGMKFESKQLAESFKDAFNKVKVVTATNEDCVSQKPQAQLASADTRNSTTVDIAATGSVNATEAPEANTGTTVAPSVMAADGQVPSKHKASTVEPRGHVYSRKNAHIGSRGSWDLACAPITKIEDRITKMLRRTQFRSSTSVNQRPRSQGKAEGKRSAASSADESSDVSGGPQKLQKAAAGESPSKAATAQSQLALISITQLLIEAHGINTNLGAVRYKEAIREAREIASTTRSDSDLSGRIQAAAFTPHPEKCKWMANTPSWHQAALKELITALGVISIIESLHAAIDIDTNRGSVPCYRKIVERARDLAVAIDINPELPGLIEAAAFKPLARTSTWMPNTPACHRQALVDLMKVLALAKIKHVLSKGMTIDTNRGSTRYRELVQQAQEVAEATKIDPSLPTRIANAAFKPLPRTGKWMANTPSCHQEALKKLIEKLDREEKRMDLTFSLGKKVSETAGWHGVAQGKGASSSSS